MEDSVILEAINNGSKRNETALRDFQSQILTSLERLERKIDEHKCPDIIKQTEKLNMHIQQEEKFKNRVAQSGIGFFTAITGIIVERFVK